MKWHIYEIKNQGLIKAEIRYGMCVAPIPDDTWRQDPDYNPRVGMLTSNQASLFLRAGTTPAVPGFNFAWELERSKAA